jgi:glycosyltransferase involved in cell wall biosynthesis
MRDALGRRGVETAVIDLSPPGLSKGRVRRLGRVARGIGQFFIRTVLDPPAAVYLSVAGGWGQVYDILFVGLARLRGLAPVLHHHSYAYLTSRRLHAAVLIKIAGKGAMHVVGCQDMGQRLQDRYDRQATTLVLSNAQLVEGSLAYPPRTRGAVRTIGYFSNITEEKGILEFLALARALARSGHHVRALVAGPFLEPRIRASVLDSIEALDDVTYVGPKYGDDKTEFFDQIDVLVFPTKYRNEAEPVTVLEAMAHGVPVIAWGRGCIPGMIPLDGGMVIDSAVEFVGPASSYLDTWITTPDRFALLAEGAIRGFRLRAAASREAFEQLLHRLGAQSLSAQSGQTSDDMRWRSIQFRGFHS